MDLRIATAQEVAAQGLPGPLAGSPPRHPGSVRRTTSLDLHWPQGPRGPMVLAGRARDLVTSEAGTARVHASALVNATVADGVVTSLVAHPDTRRVAGLAGRKLAVGFRTAVWRSLRDHYDAGSPLHQLLDEMPISLIIGGFSLRRREPEQTPPSQRRLDVCAGWATGGVAHTHREAHDRPPAPHLRVAPSLVDPADPDGWHTLPELEPWAMSRRRRLDVLDLGDGAALDALFRDSWRHPDGYDEVLHEYEVQAMIDRDGKVRDVRAIPHVLPHFDCPSGAASARRITGAKVVDLREWVSFNLFGPMSCTHLNDTLRSLADAPKLATIPVA